MKLSNYNIVEKFNEKYLIFNSLHGNLVVVEGEDYKDFICINNNNKNFETWTKEKLIVEDNVDELEKKLNSINREETKQIITIFTTTACNARCDYCFEQGITLLYMSEDMAKQIACKIINNITTSSLHITWFGGEPLLNPHAIDIITDIVKTYCKLNGIIYSASIITNGSLINDDIITKMKNKWEIKAIQISFDGIKQEYDKIKKYVDNKSFDEVFENIKNLVNNGLNVNIRVNFDKNNFEKALGLVDFFVNEGLTSEKINIYYAPISHSNIILSSAEKCSMYEHIFNKLIKYNFIKNINYFQFRFSIYHCQADSKKSYAIFPNGYLAKCNHEKPISSKINIFEDDCLAKLNNEWDAMVSLKDADRCKQCKLLPQCSFGCKINDFTKLTKTHCDRCYNYQDIMHAIMQALAKVYKI